MRGPSSGRGKISHFLRVMSATPTLHALAGLITLRRCQFPPSVQTVTRRVSAGTKRLSLAHSASRHFSSSICLKTAPHKASKHDNYDKAEWIEKLQARKEHQNRELTDKEKEAFLEQRKKRLEQLRTPPYCCYVLEQFYV